MKLLRNIFFSGLVIAACTACSNDDADSKAKHPNAKLTIGVCTVDTNTKAYNPNDANELAGEANINNLAVLVFNEDGSDILGWDWQPVRKEYTALLENVPVVAEKARIVILANVEEALIKSATTYEDFQARLAELSSQSTGSLTMSSEVIVTDTYLKIGENYLGYADKGNENINGISSPVLLTRIAARIDVAGIVTHFAGTPLAGRTVRIDEISVRNQKTKSYYFSETDWGKVEAPGNVANSDVSLFENTLVSDKDSISTTSYIHYVMENLSGETPTQLVVKATLLASGNEKEQTKTFTAVINANGTNKGYKHNFIKRNYVYRLHLSFDGNSFEITTPPESVGSLNVAVEVRAWGVVNQDVVID